MTILEPVKINAGLCLLVGDYEQLVSLLNEDGIHDAGAGPLGCIAVRSPKDRRVEYTVRLVKNPAVFGPIVLPIIASQWKNDGANNTTVIFCVDSFDPLKAYLRIVKWIRVLLDGILTLLKSDPQLTGLFKDTGAQSVLANLGIRSHVVLIESGKPAPCLALALRRLAKDQGCDTTLTIQHDDTGHPNLARLRLLITGEYDETAMPVLMPASRLFMPAAQDTQIDDLLARGTVVETTLESVAAPAEVATGPLANREVMRLEKETEVSLGSCLRSIWRQWQTATGKDQFLVGDHA